MPVVIPSSPQPSPTSPVEPLDLRDIGDLPVKLELRYAIESRRSEKGLEIPVTMVEPKKQKQQVLMNIQVTLKDKSGVDKIIIKKQSYQLLNTNREFFPSFDASNFHISVNESSLVRPNIVAILYFVRVCEGAIRRLVM